MTVGRRESCIMPHQSAAPAAARQIINPLGIGTALSRATELYKSVAWQGVQVCWPFFDCIDARHSPSLCVAVAFVSAFCVEFCAEAMLVARAAAIVLPRCI